jgi:hypothetical protein
VTASPTPAAPAEPDGTPIIDFGRGSREQTQGGPSQDRGNVQPIRKPADAPAPRG